VWANVFPREVHDMCQAFFQKDLIKAVEIQTRFKTFIDSLFIETNPIPLKACMEMMDMDSGNLRLPLTRAQDSTYAKVRDSLEALGAL
jgi:4-hydroxy-tetrahydrodipicolinate synthase